MDGCRALREKYLTLQRLRHAHARSGQVAPRAQLRALSQRFPGALRELDRSSLERIEAHLGALEAALSGQGPEPSWVPPQLAYHGLLRTALQLRAGAPGEAPAAALARLRAELAGETVALDPALLSEADLEAIRRPPGGRLNGWVYVWLGERFGLEPPALDVVLFGEGACGHE